MRTSLGRPSRWFRALVPLAFVGAAAWLAVQLFGSFEVVAAMSVEGLAVGAFAFPVAVALTVAAALRGLARIDPEARRRTFDEAALVPCALAPLAVLSPWVVAPSHLGPSLESLPFFVGWLTRYPTIGGVNHEVLLGIGALLGASAVPAFLAFAVASGRDVSARGAAIACVLQLVAYAPLFVELDAWTLACGAVAMVEGPISVFGGSDTAWWQNAGFGFVVGSGALLRLSATASMFVFLARVVARRGEPAVVWEMS